MLGIEPGAIERAASSLNSQAISPACVSLVLSIATIIYAIIHIFILIYRHLGPERESALLDLTQPVDQEPNTVCSVHSMTSLFPMQQYLWGHTECLSHGQRMGDQECQIGSHGRAHNHGVLVQCQGKCSRHAVEYSQESIRSFPHSFGGILEFVVQCVCRHHPCCMVC